MTYLPEIALFRFEQKPGFLPPRIIDLRIGVPAATAPDLDDALVRERPSGLGYLG